MKETMYSGKRDGVAQMIWVCGDFMATTTDHGADDVWRDINHDRSRDFSQYHSQPLDLTRFTDLTVVWERNS